jgi:transposase
VNDKKLSSQDFWNNINLLEHDQIIKIETEIVKTVIKTYSIDNIKFDEIKRKILGEKVLFTDRHDLPKGQIISAYNSQFNIEKCFKHIKNAEHLTFSHSKEFTDNNLRVQIFCCFLALILYISLKIEFERMGHNLTVFKALELLSDIKQIINVYNDKDQQTGGTYMFTEMTGLAKKYIEKFNLEKYAFC